MAIILRSQYRAPMLICDEDAALRQALETHLDAGFVLMVSPSAERGNAELRALLDALARDPRCRGRIGTLDDLQRQCSDVPCPTLLAVGGGSVIDRAKVIKAGAAERGLPVHLVTLPTTLGSGSERNDVAVWVDDKGVKRNGAGAPFQVDFALWYLPLLASVDDRRLATGLFDAFMHLFERFFFRGRTGIEAWDGVNLDIARQLMQAITALGTQARDTATALYLVRLVNAANAFDVDMNPRVDWGLHQISHVLQRYYPETAHGALLAALLPRWLALRLGAGDAVVHAWLCTVLGRPRDSTAADLLAALETHLECLGELPDPTIARRPEHWDAFVAEVAAMNPSGTVGNYFIIGAAELTRLLDTDVSRP